MDTFLVTAARGGGRGSEVCSRLCYPSIPFSRNPFMVTPSSRLILHLYIAYHNTITRNCSHFSQLLPPYLPYFFGYKAHRFFLESPYFCRKLSLNLGCVLIYTNIFWQQIIKISSFQYYYAINRNIVGR